MSIIQRRIIHGDLFEVLPDLPSKSIDACVTDPPYGLEFMGKEWDSLDGRNLDMRQPGNPTLHLSGSGPHDRAKVRHSSAPSYGGSAGGAMQKWHEAWAEEVYRVLKPGGHIVAFGGTRTFHRLTCALEDAGFEIRDCLSWLYGSGFPKSLNVQQAINKAEAGYPQGGADPTGPNHGKFKGGCTEDYPTGHPGAGPGKFMEEQGNGRGQDEGPWQGWGTALKPAWEPIILARRPMLRSTDETIAENVLKYGTGAININACRIETGDNLNGGAYAKQPSVRHDGDENWRYKEGGGGEYVQPIGRWPANVMLDEEAAVQLDAQSGATVSSGGQASLGAFREGDIYGKGRVEVEKRDPGYGDFGGASRFFYCAKASRSERDAGCENLPALSGGEATDRVDGSAGTNSPRAGAGRTGGSHNGHPTVKPVAVMRWLVKLVTPPGGVVLDPFLGSGTTAIACVREGFGYIGIERELDYVKIASARITHARMASSDGK